MYKLIRFACKLAMFPIFFALWLVMTPLIVVICFCENDNADGFVRDFRDWVETLTEKITLD